MANVIVLQNVTIALRTVQKLMVQLDSSFQGSQIGPVEPVNLKVKHLMLTHALSPVQYNNVAVQVMNTDTAPATLYKGTKLGSFTPQEYILLLIRLP